MEPLEFRIRNDLTKNGFNHVREIVVEEGPDATGDDSLFVWILVDDALSDEDLDWANIKPLVDEARSEAMAANPRRYPYVRVRRAREWEELANR